MALNDLAYSLRSRVQNTDSDTLQINKEEFLAVVSLIDDMGKTLDLADSGIDTLVKELDGREADLTREEEGDDIPEEVSLRGVTAIAASNLCGLSLHAVGACHA